MGKLAGMRCEACRRDAPRLTDAELGALLPQVPGWHVMERDGVRALERRFVFDDFAGALEFTRRVGELAEREGHHPRLVTEWGRVHVTWYTKKIRGLHRNDFIMAAKTNTLHPQAGLDEREDG
jgi:4a-hydroxytetrahydrobiopterin dehydratase